MKSVAENISTHRNTFIHADKKKKKTAVTERNKIEQRAILPLPIPFMTAIMNSISIIKIRIFIFLTKISLSKSNKYSKFKRNYQVAIRTITFSTF